MNALLNLTNLPQFSDIRVADMTPAINQVLTDARQTIKQLEQITQPGWDNLVAPVEQIENQTNRVWAQISHLNSVMDSEALRTAYQDGVEKLTLFSTEFGQNQSLYALYKSLRSSSKFTELNVAQQKVIENQLLTFRLAGADLNEADKQQLKEINQQLSSLATEFEENVLDATQAWQKQIIDEAALDGIPPSALAMMAAAASAADQEGWLISLQVPSYLSVMLHAKDRTLREEVYKAYAKRASELSDDGKFDNSEQISAILKLRQQRAMLLGYANYTELSLVKKMANDSDEVIRFLRDLAATAKPVAEREYKELQDFAQSIDGLQQLQPWDVSYYSERLKEQRHKISDEMIRPYLPVDRVIEGIFSITQKLFNVQLREKPHVDVWHEDVKYFELFDSENGNQLGGLYTDLYVRKNKRSGAWMGTCMDRYQTDNLQLPVAFLTCNFTPPIDSKPALLTHNEVETLFHEFGHTLHHLLTKVNEVSLSGINGVAWDAVELPSQFFENWCWHTEGLQCIAAHYESGEPLPETLLERMRAAKNFQAGMQTVRQIEFALFDILIHTASGEQLTQTGFVQDTLDKVRAEVAVVISPAFHRFQNSFSHIFAGGYAAGYYSYKWAEVLSADAFAKFEQDGVFNQRTGQQFKHTILENGGVIDARELFIRFRGREPKIDALLRQTGILA